MGTDMKEDSTIELDPRDLLGLSQVEVSGKHAFHDQRRYPCLYPLACDSSCGSRNPREPGPVWTPLNPADKAAERVAKFGSDTPMKRPAQPEEIAPAFVFLAAPSCSSYITGEVLPIIGGYSGG
jgi:Enoyl-(Acyl carrier protein) reductase